MYIYLIFSFASSEAIDDRSTDKIIIEYLLIEESSLKICDSILNTGREIMFFQNLFRLTFVIIT